MAMIKKKPAAKKEPEFTLQQKLGTFTFEGNIATELAEVGCKIMAGVLILQATYNPRTESYEYVGMSEHFEGVPDDEDVPAYDVAWDEETETATWTKTEAG